MGFQTIRIREQALSLFLKAAAKLQECEGKTDDDDLWSFAIGPSSDTQDAISESVRRLAAVEDTLYDLLQSCKRKLEMIKAGSRQAISGCGIQSLPDDLLIGIFNRVAGDHDELGLPRPQPTFYSTPELRPRPARDHPELALTSVCTRFRSLALGIPALWSSIESTMPNDVAVSRLSLSKGCLLTIIINATFWSDGLQQFVGLVASHARRWVSFDSNLKHYDPIGSLEPGMENLQLPQLTSFNVQSNHLDYYKNWDMPKLRYVGISGWILHMPPRVFSVQTIKSLYIDEAIFNPELVEYLTSVPNLTELHITIFAVRRDDGPALDVFNFHGTLPRLRQMTLQTRNETALHVMIGRIRMPELSTLCLYVHCREVWNIAQLTSFETYPSVKELSIWYYNCFRDEDELGSFSFNRIMELSPLFYLFPEMQSLNLLNSCRNFRFYNDVIMPPLRYLSALISHGDFFLLRDLAESLVRDGRWEQFEYFRPLVEDGLSRSDVDSIFTKKKVKWYE